MKKTFASSDLTMGQLNAIVKKLGGYEGALKFLRDEVVVSTPQRHWNKEGGVITFTLTSDGTTGEEWIARLEGKGFLTSDWSQNILKSKEFIPTSGITTKIGVITGSMLSGKKTREAIFQEAKRRGWKRPNTEVGFLIREKFTGEDLKSMGLKYLVVEHEPIFSPVIDTEPTQLFLYRKKSLTPFNNEGSDYLCGTRTLTDYFIESDEGHAFMIE